MLRLAAFLMVSLALCFPLASLTGNPPVAAQSSTTPGTPGPDLPFDDATTGPPPTLSSRTSPVPPQESNDSNFVVDSGAYLDRYLFRGNVPDGRLPLTIKIDRYYSPLITSDSVDGDGFLIDRVRNDLIDRGLLPEQATLTLQVYDVDHASSVCPEVDHVYVNGRQLQAAGGGGTASLTSGNDTWSTWSVPIPIELIKFPLAPGSDTARPAAVDQLVEIDVDTLVCPRGNGESGTAWAVQVDWGAITIASPIRPILFAHGWTGDTTTFNNFERLARADGIPSAGQPALARGILPIPETAPLLVDAMTAATTRFGVDKVNIFAHSKGGLVARYALRNSAVAEQVDHLVTFGSPHHGVAGWQMDVAIWNNCSDTNFPDAADLQACRDAGEAIKVDNFRSFNYTGCRQESSWWGMSQTWVGCEPVYIRQPEVEYRSLVGGALDIGAKNATYPWNADARPFPNNANVDETFGFESHVSIKDAEQAYRCGIGFVDSAIHADCSDAGANAYPQAGLALLTPGPNDQIVLHQEASLAAGAEASALAPVDGGPLAVFSAFSGAGELSVTLVAPDGSTITPANVASFAGVTYTAEAAGAVSEGWSYQYQVASPAVGTWTLRAQALGATRATLVATVQSTTALALRTDKATYSPSENVTIEAILSQDATILTGATVTGEARGPGSAVIPLAFNDTGASGDATAGDGIMTARISAPATEGLYSLQLTATQGAVQRVQTGSFAVAVQSATIQPVISANTRDTNGNGLFDWLDLTVGVAVTRAGHFELVGTLVDGAGNRITSAAVDTRREGTPLSTGSRSLTLSFDGEVIRRHGADGPYTLTNLVLYDLTGDPVAIDTATAHFNTSAYSHTKFERAAILFASGGETLVDEDGDGRYDELVISVQFDLVSSGNYSWNGRLVDRQGREIGWYVASGALDNTTPAVFRFDGKRIGSGSHEGPYVLRDVSLYRTSGGEANGLFTKLYTTTASSFFDFAGGELKLFLPLIRR